MEKNDVFCKDICFLEIFSENDKFSAEDEK